MTSQFVMLHILEARQSSPLGQGHVTNVLPVTFGLSAAMQDSRGGSCMGNTVRVAALPRIHRAAWLV